MTRTGHSNLLPLDPKIERTIRRLQQERNMAAEDPNDIKLGVDITTEGRHEAIRPVHRPLNDYITSSVVDAASSIRRPPVRPNNFEIKSMMIQMIQSTIQFSGHVHDDPNAHISNFLELCDTFKINGVLDVAIRLRLFPFSLRDKAKN